MPSERTVRNPKPEVCDLAGLAAILRSDFSAVERAIKAGEMPAHLVIAGQPRWRLDEVRTWIEAGCPAQKDWEWPRKPKPRAVPTKEKATSRRRQFDKLPLPRVGKGVFAWTREMEKTFQTELVDGMGREGEKLGCGSRFDAWNDAQVRAIAMGAIEYLRGLATYKGQFEHLFRAIPPWDDAASTDATMPLFDRAP